MLFTKADKRAVELALADNRVAEIDLDWNAEVLAALDIDLSQFWNEEELAALALTLVTTREQRRLCS